MRILKWNEILSVRNFIPKFDPRKKGRNKRINNLM